MNCNTGRMDLSTIISSRPGSFTQLTFWSVLLSWFIYDYWLFLLHMLSVFFYLLISITLQQKKPSETCDLWRVLKSLYQTWSRSFHLQVQGLACAQYRRANTHCKMSNPFPKYYASVLETFLKFQSFVVVSLFIRCDAKCVNKRIICCFLRHRVFIRDCERGVKLFLQKTSRGG